MDVKQNNYHTTSIQQLDPANLTDIYKQASLYDLIKMTVPKSATNLAQGNHGQEGDVSFIQKAIFEQSQRKEKGEEPPYQHSKDQYETAEFAHNTRTQDHNKEIASLMS